MIRARLTFILILLVFGSGVFAAETVVKTELYFGLSKPDGSVVSNAEWTDFLDTCVTPSFKEGLTALDAEGRYLDASGKTHTERSKLVILIHVPSREKSAALATIIAQYKTLFKQESVLQTTTSIHGTLHDAAPPPTGPLGEYLLHNDSARLNDPAEYIAYLKKTRFKNGELDHLPENAIVLHCDDPATLIKAAGDEVISVIETGSASPNRLLIGKRKSGTLYLVNRGLPGAGGIATQTAELGALGVKRVVHIGTCAELGNAYNAKTVLVSTGSYKDGAAVLLSANDGSAVQPLSRPDGDLSGALTSALKRRAIRVGSGVGYCIPIYYYQPSGLILDLLSGAKYAHDKPIFMEMEEAAFFETAKRAGLKSASLVVPADTYFLSDGKLRHEFTGDPGPAMLDAFKAAVEVLEK